MVKAIDEKRYLKNLKEKLAKHNIVFDDNSVLMFDNHMLTFIERIKSDELLNSSKEEYEMILPELSKFSIELATEISEELAESFSMSPTMMEIILVATHLQSNLIEEKGE